MQTQTALVNALAKLLAAQVKTPKRVKTASKRAVSVSPEEKAAENDARCKRAFKRAGYGDVTPRVDVLTYGKWIEAGFKVRKGEKSVKVGTLRLFHRSQCDAITAEEREALLAAKN